MSRLGHFKWLVAGIAAVAAAFCAGCGGDGNPANGGGDMSRLSVNGAQVYGYGGFESNYTGSFTYFGYDDFRFTDLFTNPVVSMTGGKLTINLGEPSVYIGPIKAFFEEELGVEKLTVSDPSARAICTEGFIGDCSDDRNCNSGLYVFNANNPAYEYLLFYLDKQVTVSGNVRWCDWDDVADNCNYIQRTFSINFRKGWNAIGFLDDVDVNNRPLIINTEDLSGSGDLKWLIWNDDDSHLVVPMPTTTPTQLTESVWVNGDITSTAFGSAVWYSFNVVSGETYNVLWDDNYRDNSTKTLTILVSAVYSGGSRIFINKDNWDNWNQWSPLSFTAIENGTVLIRVSPLNPGQTGTFGIRYYHASSASPAVSGLDKRGGEPNYRGNTTKRQKRLKDGPYRLFRHI